MSNLEPIFREKFSSLSLGGKDGLFEKQFRPCRTESFLVLFFATFFLICKKHTKRKKSKNCFPMLRFGFGIHRPDYTMGSPAFWQIDCIISMARPDSGLILCFGINTITPKSQQKFWVVKNGWDENVKKIKALLSSEQDFLWVNWLCNTVVNPKALINYLGTFKEK